MKLRQYEEEYNKIQNEIKNIEKKEQECIELKQKIELEEEERDKEIRRAIMLNDEIEEDWRSRNMLGNREYIFSDGEMLFKKVCSERNNILVDGMKDLNQYVKKLSWQEEDCREQLSRLSREYAENKEGDEDGMNY